MRGWLGGFAFSSPAWKLDARDQWIGWDDETRKTKLNQLICNNRFLILPFVKVPHFASPVLGKVLKRLEKDWGNRYPIKPVLVETFVDPSRFQGICYKASNWKYIGQTQGLGRNASSKEQSGVIKNIYLYPLRENVQTYLNEGRALVELPLSGPKEWAEEEFDLTKFTDTRRVKLNKDRS